MIGNIEARQIYSNRIQVHLYCKNVICIEDFQVKKYKSIKYCTQYPVYVAYARRTGNWYLTK